MQLPISTIRKFVQSSKESPQGVIQKEHGATTRPIPKGRAGEGMVAFFCCKCNLTLTGRVTIRVLASPLALSYPPAETSRTQSRPLG